MSYIGKVDIGETTHLVGSTLYGTCSTAANVQEKAVDCANFDQLFTGVTIHVKFSYSNTASSPALNVNGTGRRLIGRYTATTAGNSRETSWNVGAVVSFTYDGSYWMMNDWLNTTYTAATSAPGNVSTSSAVGTSTNYARQDHTHGIDLATGDNNGQVKIAGTNVSVKGLGALAYEDDISTLTNAQVTAAVTAGWNS